MNKLTDKQCDEFRRLPGSFNDMVRAIYQAGMDAQREWQPIETAPKGKPGFLATTDDNDCIEWLIDWSDADRLLNQNSGNYTERRHWKHWTPLPPPPNNKGD